MTEDRAATPTRISQQPPSPQFLFTSAGRAWTGLEAALVQVPGNVRSQVQTSQSHRLGMHFGTPVHADCSIDGQRVQRLQKPGDIGLVPAGSHGTWQDDADCQILRLELQDWLLDDVAREMGRDRSKIELIPRIQLRDPRIEAIGWAIKADLEADVPSDPLFIDGLANALAVRLIEMASAATLPLEPTIALTMSARKLRTLTDYIEANLHRRLHLADLASIVGLSATRLKAMFRNSTGTSVHQYVLRRRVEYARALMTTTAIPASEIAIAAGFAHQSHMASTMRRILGHTPRAIIRPSR